LNLHASLLPWGRGASPIQAAVLAGLSASGWSAMIMEEGLDTGPVLARRELALAVDWNAGDFYAALKDCAPAFLLETLRGWRDGKLSPQPQDESGATFTRKIPREAGALDWRDDAERLDRQIKAYTPAPGCWCRLAGRRLGILRAAPAAAPAGSAPGRILEAGPRLQVACGRGALEILEVQPEGRRAMAAAEYLRGRSLAGVPGLENG
jgi:methionyl-tRNA formyltransferase